MNRTKTFFTMAATAAAIFLGPRLGSAAEGEAPAPTPEERRAEMLRRTGGPIAVPEKGPWIAVVRGGGGAGAETVDEAVAYLRKVFRLPVREKEAADAVAAAKAEVADGAAIAVAVVDAPDMPSLSVFPTEQYGVVNAASLAAGDPALFAVRLRKEFLRCVAYTFGAGNSSGKCVLKPARGVEGLDANPMLNYGPETLAAVMKSARERGMSMLRTVPYRRAVQEGWAPPPTNDIQRAVWDDEKAHSAERDANATPAAQ